VRALIVLCLLAGGERPDRCCTTKRSDLVSWLSDGLPERGVMHAVSGLGSYGPVKKQETVDYAKRTLVVVPWEGAQTTRELSADDVNRIKTLADTAWRGPAPAVSDHIHDYLETVIIADHDDVFAVSAGHKLEETSLAPLITALR